MHAQYLGIIIALTIIIVYAVARVNRVESAIGIIRKNFKIQNGLKLAIPRSEPLRALSPAEVRAPRTLVQYRAEIDQIINRAIALNEFEQMTEPCKYALEGGKRIRSTMALEIARQLGTVDIAEIALFIEYVHTASLIVDDMPEFDNDVERRGKPSLHVQFGVAAAQMAALSLMATGVHNICRQLDALREKYPDAKNIDVLGTYLYSDITRAITLAASGQYIDIAEQADKTEVEKVLYRKTATLFEVSTVAGWLIGGGSTEKLDAVRDIGKHTGTAFQIADDIHDIETDTGVWNYARNYGLEIANVELQKHLNIAHYKCLELKLWSPLMSELFNSIS